VIQPQVGEFFLDGVLAEPGGKIRKIYSIHFLIRLSRKDDGLFGPDQAVSEHCT
jgi:hypothetical protein